ncbi:hypothetical protein BDN70DRAFT_874699 [Pholiota conissans]|uniref:Uncharacterized protein n=1 Tax=Pholiota conissans TaxID=109636 RepID=A0A9P6D3P6_9AGAR|nr:hypothetical protein BDN70DRAFT_874699 [Pholiota conissans]
MSSIYGLVIPRDNVIPSLQRICSSDLAGIYKGFLGIDKTFDLGQHFIVKTSRFTWPDQDEYI